MYRMNLNECLFLMLEYLRNGAIIVGDSHWCHTFRRTCLLEANKIYIYDIAPIIGPRYQGFNTTQSGIHTFEEYLRNGCLVANKMEGVVDMKDVNIYLEMCVGRGFWHFCNDILGQLIYDQLVEETQELMNLADVCAFRQQRIIRPKVFDECKASILSVHSQIGVKPLQF